MTGLDDATQREEIEYAWWDISPNPYEIAEMRGSYVSHEEYMGMVLRSAPVDCEFKRQLEEEDSKLIEILNGLIAWCDKEIEKYEGKP